MTGWKEANDLDTLAAACAEAANFDAAVKWQEKAIGLLAKNDELSRKRFGDRLKLYRERKPYHEESKVVAAPNESTKPARH